jgi:dsRNA-specific ribonuclease
MESKHELLDNLLDIKSEEIKIENVRDVFGHFTELNQNGKRRIDDDIDENMDQEKKEEPVINTDTELNIVKPLSKEEKVKQKFARLTQKRKFKRRKTEKKQVIYREGISQAQLLNECMPNLKYEFDLIVNPLSTANKNTYICKVGIKKDQNFFHSNEIDDQFIYFTGDGQSKKDAKKKCCHLVLLALYPDTYKPPKNVIDIFAEKDALISESAPDKIKNQQQNYENSENTDPANTEVFKRLVKLCTKANVMTKNATQLLHEACAKVSDKGKCISESGPSAEQRFCYQFINCISSSYREGEQLSDPSLLAYGYGRNKKEAKNVAANNALKQFFNFDMQQIFAQAAAITAMSSAAAAVKESNPTLDPQKIQINL